MFGQFKKWLAEAKALGQVPPEGMAMTLATASSRGLPSARVRKRVLSLSRGVPLTDPEMRNVTRHAVICMAQVMVLRAVDEHGFVFFTNYNSRKVSRQIRSYVVVRTPRAVPVPVPAALHV